MASTMRESGRETIRDAQEAIRESSQAATAVSGDIQRDLEALRNDIARLAAQIADIFAAKGNAAWKRARSNVEGVVSDVGARGQDAIEAVSEMGDHAIGALDESLKKRPYTTLAVALGIGFLFGSLWRR
ncbi:MAG TPA: hypothetical protein VGF60_04815 [Xanthobacteraceae bacterium]|jgi:ElaB/YqjD/DUF883 family membrane-anchored ribosome-binding protein